MFVKGIKGLLPKHWRWRRNPCQRCFNDIVIIVIIAIIIIVVVVAWAGSSCYRILRIAIVDHLCGWRVLVGFRNTRVEFVNLFV